MSDDEGEGRRSDRFEAERKREFSDSQADEPPSKRPRNSPHGLPPRNNGQNVPQGLRAPPPVGAARPPFPGGAAYPFLPDLMHEGGEGNEWNSGRFRPRGPPMGRPPMRGGPVPRRGGPGPMMRPSGGALLYERPRAGPSRPPFQYSVMPLAQWSEKAAASEADTDEGLDTAGRYAKFKLKAVKAQAEQIFHAYKGALWFREQYHGDAYTSRCTERSAVAARRAALFASFVEAGRFDSVEFPERIDSPMGQTVVGLVKSLAADLEEVDPDEISKGSPTKAPAPPPGEIRVTLEKAAEKKLEEKKEEATVVENGSAGVQDNAGDADQASEPDATKKATDEQGEQELLDFDEEADAPQEPISEVTATGTDVEPESASKVSASVSAGGNGAAVLSPPPPVSRSFSVKLNLRIEVPIHELRDALKAIAGFHRLAVAYPTELWNLAPGKRLIWATFVGVLVPPTMTALRRMMLGRDPLLSHTQIAPRDTAAVRIASGFGVVDEDTTLAARLVEVLDNHTGLWQDDSGPNPVLPSDTEARSLPKLVLYLRVVHSLDFYSGLMIPHEDGMAQRFGAMTLPDIKTSKPPSHFARERRERLQGIVGACTECTELGVETLERSEEEAVNDFVANNTHALPDGTFRCPLSGKRFTSPDFVRKHILTKHTATIEQYKRDAAYMNVYLRDPFRPRALPIATIAPPAVREVDEFGRDISQLRVRARPVRLHEPMLARTRPQYRDI